MQLRRSSYTADNKYKVFNKYDYTNNSGQDKF